MSRFPFGKDAVLYYSATPLDGTVTVDNNSWTEYDNVRDVTGNFAETTVDATTRAVAKLGWEAEDVVLNKGEISLNIPQPQPGTVDAFLTALKTAWLNKTTVTVMALTGSNAVAGNEGLGGNFSVSLKQNQPLKDLQSWDVTLRLSSYPGWRTVT